MGVHGVAGNKWCLICSVTPGGLAMNHETAVTSCLIAQPFDKALKAVRRTLADAELTVPGELDVAGHIQRQLYVGFAPCRILFVDAPYLLLEALVVERAAATFLPLHLVVSARGNRTLVQWIDLAAVQPPRLPAKALPFARLVQLQLSTALARIAEPEDAVVGSAVAGLTRERCRLTPDGGRTSPSGRSRCGG
jgi:uncharacterized protein (DUF302 family)